MSKIISYSSVYLIRSDALDEFGEHIRNELRHADHTDSVVSPRFASD